jgi:hypothetical protein
MQVVRRLAGHHAHADHELGAFARRLAVGLRAAQDARPAEDLGDDGACVRREGHADEKTETDDEQLGKPRSIGVAAHASIRTRS